MRSGHCVSRCNLQDHLNSQATITRRGCQVIVTETVGNLDKKKTKEVCNGFGRENRGDTERTP